MSAETRTCSGCGVQVAGNWIFCPACGQRLRSVCARCGAPLDESWSFCAFCGRKLAGADAPIGATLEAARQEAGRRTGSQADQLNDEGSDLYDSEQYDQAAVKFEEAVKLDPNSALYRCNLGLALQALGEMEQALEQYKEAARRTPTDPVPRLNLGYFFSELERFDEAEKHFKAVIELAPESDEAEEAREALASMEGN